MCSLEIQGHKKSIEKFYSKSFIEKDNEIEFIFSGVVPMPKWIQKTLEDPSKWIKKKNRKFTDWYDWSIANWGCKWEAGQCFNMERLPEKLCFSFDTAWSPPIEYVKKASKKFPSLHFKLRYGEPGMCFAGEYNACFNKGIDNDINFDEGSDEYYELVGQPQ